jgi:predicted nucleic acid-binding protein
VTRVVVVDASAVASLLFGEPDADAVAARLEGDRYAAPSLLRYELASVYTKKLRRNPGQRARLREALRLLPRLGIDEVQVPTDGMAELVEESGLTAYDAAYLWLALHLGAPLLTLDRRLTGAAEDLGLGAPS